MRYRKKPVVIEAMEYTVENCQAIHEWMGVEHANHTADCDLGFAIDTLEGQMTANLGDWIIKGVKGEFYPCKPDIFEATYEPEGCSHTSGMVYNSELDAAVCPECGHVQYEEMGG